MAQQEPRDPVCTVFVHGWPITMAIRNSVLQQNDSHRYLLVISSFRQGWNLNGRNCVFSSCFACVFGLRIQSAEHYCGWDNAIALWNSLMFCLLPCQCCCHCGNNNVDSCHFWEWTKIVSSNDAMYINPLSATWRIYPSSKWSSQWPYDGYIRHGWMTSCGRGRDSATLECFGRGYWGTIFVRSSKLSLFFPELCPFRRVFLFPALLKDLAPNVQALGLLVSTMFWGSFWKLRSVTGHFFANSFNDHKYFLKISFLFSKAQPVLLAWQLWRSQVWAKHFGDGTSKTRLKTRLPGVGEIERRGPSIVVAAWLVRVVCDDPWSRREKKTQGSQRVIVRRLNPSSSTNQRVLRSLFPRPDVATVSHFAVFVDVDVQLQDGQAAARGQRRKAVIRDISGLDHWGVTNLSAPIWFTGQRHCTVFRHVMQLSLLVLCWKSTLTVILPQIKKRRSLSNVGHRGIKAENLAWHSTG